jgi:predicted ribosomally synthesized peptide with SipW-like signal peptide
VRNILLCLIILCALLGGALAGTLADFSDIETSRDNVFEVGEWAWPPPTDSGGTIGFWKRDKTYTEAQINTWLAIIDDNSEWLVPDIDGDSDIDVQDMDIIMAQAKGGTMEQKFLAHYLATRLNAESGRLYLEATHDFSAYDPGNYLGLDGSGTLEQIISALESKYDTSPTKNQFGIMKDICDELNNVRI